MVMELSVVVVDISSKTINVRRDIDKKNQGLDSIRGILKDDPGTVPISLRT